MALGLGFRGFIGFRVMLAHLAARKVTTSYILLGAPHLV